LWIQSARVLTELSEREIAEVTGVSRSSVYRIPVQNTPQVALLARIAGDPRFPGLL
jgi:transcriptional regulator with XRE-family HTH domain